MSEELNNSEHQITADKPEKDPRKVEAGKKLAAFNKMVRKWKESPKGPGHGETNSEEGPEYREEEMSGTTKILLLAGAAGLGYYIYTTTNNSGPQQQQQQQPVTQNNNEVQENTVSKLRTFKN